MNKLTDDSLIFDIREHFQRDKFILNKTSISSPVNNFHRNIPLLKRKKTTVFIYDAVGKQVRWLQYLLEKNNIENYYFMQGGVKGYIEAKLDK